MNKLVQRLLIFTVAIPLIVAVVLLLDHFNHLAFNILTVVFSAVGAMEFSIMLAKKNIKISRIEAAVLGALPPAVMTLIVSFNVADTFLIFAAFTAAVLWMLLSRIISRGEALESFANRLAAGLSVLTYPGLLMAWLTGMSRWENSGILILTFLCIVFASDSAAWATGMLFGKNNKGVFPASPNKSIAGFIGGTAGAVVLGGLATMFLPEAFSLQSGTFAPGAALGLLTGVAAAVGDLAESAIKRSTGTKDSGKLILGRGGALDCIDSITFAAPVFYIAIVCFLF